MEIELEGSTETQRTVYYSAGGAFRIIGGEDEGLYFRHGDHLGSTSVLSDSTGAKVENSDMLYAPFGEVRTGELSDLTDFGFTGQILDRSSGDLMYYRARYYLPGLKRFISADTIVPSTAWQKRVNREGRR
jgi:RHS repeat-associated protein